MKPTDDIHKLIRKLQIEPGAEMDRRVHGRITRALEKWEKTKSVAKQPNIWRMIMNRPITKLVTAAVIIIAVILSMNLLDKSIPAAYAKYTIEQSIEANHDVRYIHIKSYGPGQRKDPKEFWVQLDEWGQLVNARWYMPEWDAPEDGAKLIVWREGQLQIWFQGSKLTRKKPALVTYSHETIPRWLENLATTSNPRLMVENSKNQADQNKIDLKIYTLRRVDESELIMIKATYLPDSTLYGKQKILYVDRTTNLVAATDFYELKEGQYIHYGTQEYHDYNQEVDPNLFILDDEVPADIRRIDGDVREIRGLAQDSLSDEEIAVKVVREFFEALIAEDYEMAGQIFCGTPAEELKKGWFGENKVIRIISIGEPTPHPIPGIGGLRVPCKIEIEKDGVKSVWEPYGPFVRTTHKKMKNPRWEIHGGL